MNVGVTSSHTLANHTWRAPGAVLEMGGALGVVTMALGGGITGL